MEITAVLPIQKQKLPRHYAGRVEFFTIFQNLYLFIYSTILRGNLFDRH